MSDKEQREAIDTLFKWVFFFAILWVVGTGLERWSWRCPYKVGLQYPYKWVENNKIEGGACATARYKGSKDLDVSYKGRVMFSGKWSGGVGNIRETSGLYYKDYGEIGYCFGRAATGKEYGICFRE